MKLWGLTQVMEYAKESTKAINAVRTTPPPLCTDHSRSERCWYAETASIHSAQPSLSFHWRREGGSAELLKGCWVMVRLLEKETEKETQTCRQKDYRSTVVEDREHERQTEEQPSWWKWGCRDGWWDVLLRSLHTKSNICIFLKFISNAWKAFMCTAYLHIYTISESYKQLQNTVRNILGGIFTRDENILGVQRPFLLLLNGFNDLYLKLVTGLYV